MKELLFALIALVLFACARPVAPTGGPKDSTPPHVVPETSTPNLRTRFAERSFKLTFDEWITLQDVGTQMLVSPPLVKRPEVTLKGRTVTFKFDPEEVLRPNTTYTINFGTAVKDLHEGNPAKDLRFVFSTGDVIDSLAVSGSVADAFSGSPLENIAVMLYDVFEDSIPQKERPYYMARTDKAGQFSIPNVRAGRFKAVAIEDANQNLKWDGDAEKIGFPDSLVVVNDSLGSMAVIRVFKPLGALRLLSKDAGRYGLIRLGYSGLPDTMPVRPDQASIRWIRETDQDSLLIWYDTPDSIAWNLLAGSDTIAVRALSRSSFLQTNAIRFGDERSATPAGRSGRRGAPTTTAPAKAPAPTPPQTVTVRPVKPATLPFNNPISTIDTTRCVLVADSVETRQFNLRIDSAQPRVLQLDIPWAPETKYAFSLLPGALTDFYGSSNADTLRRNFTVPADKQLGNLVLNLESLQPGAFYVLELLNGKNLEETRVFKADSVTMHFRFEKLQPLAYTLQLIEDRNGNGRWDPGDYYTRRQPERVFIKKLEAIRANWDVEAVMEASIDSGRRRG